MTVTYLGEKPGGEKATNTEGKRIYTRTFVLNASSPSDKAYTVGSHASLPVIGSVHPQDSSAFCRTLSVTNPNPYAGWEVSADYTNERKFDPTDPESDEILTSFTGEIYQEAVDKDLNGNGIVNSAGDPFDPTATRDVADLIARIQSNHATIPPAILSYQNATNSASITIGGLVVGAGVAKHQRMDVSSRQKRGNTTFYSLTQEIHLRKIGWKLEPLDQGLREILLGKKRHILNESDLEEVTKPVPLNGSGVAITTATPGDITFLEFDLYDKLDFTALPGIT
jgi:hypothetical protein